MGLNMSEKKVFVQDSVAGLSKAYAKNEAIMRTQGNYGRTFDNYYTNVSIKSDYGREDFNRFRNGSVRPKRDEEIIRMSQEAYDNIGIVKNVIDLMGDLSKKGIRLVHRDARIQKFHRDWWTYVNGDRISERFLNYLYRIANVPVYKACGKIPNKTVSKWKSAYGMKYEEPKYETRNIPLRYNFINPTTIEHVAPLLGMFTGKNTYVIRIGQALRQSISEAKSRYKGLDIQAFINAIPEEVRKMLESKNDYIPISSEDLKIFYYKKDDWCTWAKPMIYSIFDDIVELQKMKLADVSALDGAISNIRLWRIGQLTDNPQTCLIPSPEMLEKLRSILSNNVGGGTMDLVWGPELDFKESNTQVHKFLGMTKYEPVLHNIYQGLGFGIALAGSKGFGDSAIYMQTLIERLEYGRSVLIDFWNGELKQIQEAMGFNSPARVQFDRVTIGDETGMMKLLIDLWDRNIVTDEVIQEAFDYFPDVLRKKLMKEYTDRQDKRYVPKASPFFNPQTDDELKKIILQAGGVAPSEVGLELEEKKEGEEPLVDKTAKQQMELTDKTNEHAVKLNKENNKAKIQQIKYKPRTNNGRPKNSKDAGIRKKRVAKASEDNFVNRMLWAHATQKEISNTLTEGWVKVCGKKDVRGLTTNEAEELEFLKFAALCQLKPYSSVDTLDLAKAVKGQVNNDFLVAVKGLSLAFISKNNREPTLEEKRQIQASAYALYYEEEALVNDSSEAELNLETVKTVGVGV